MVGLEKWIDIIWAYARQYNITKLKWVVSGGNSGQESIKMDYKKYISTVLLMM